MLTEDCGTTLSHAEVADQATRLVVVRALARLQCAVLGKVAPGVIELAPDTAGDRVREVVREWAELPAEHPLRIGPDLVAKAEVAADALDRRTAALSGTVPLDLEFNDVYPANIFADRSTGVLRPRFFDFGNTLRAHPFVTLHGFLDSVVDWTRRPLSDNHREELYAAYLTPWSNHLGAEPAVLRQDLYAAEPLVDVHRLISWRRLISHADPTELRTRANIPRGYLTAALQTQKPRSAS